MEDYQGSPLPLPEYEDLDQMENLRLDSDSTHSVRDQARLTNDDLMMTPEETGSNNRDISADSQSSH